MAQYTSVDGVARKVTKRYENIDGVARSILNAYTNVSGVARKYFNRLNINMKFTTTSSVDGQYEVIDRFAGVNSDGHWELLMTCKGIGSGSEYGRYSQVRINLAEFVGKTISFKYTSNSEYTGTSTRAIWFRDANDEAFEKHYLYDDVSGEFSAVIPEGTDDCRIYVWTYPSTGKTLTSHMILTDVQIDGIPIM